jgi:4-amino-4-deoxy-L-arabinose transferase-like glycosyltransferase
MLSRSDADSGTDVESPSAKRAAPFSEATLRFWTLAIIVATGLIRGWVGRYSMDPDGICYLDLGDAFFHRKWFDAVNGYWSPLYAWLLGSAMFLTKPARQWEFPVVHVVNFIVYLAALACFEFFLRSLLPRDPSTRNVATRAEDTGGASTGTLSRVALLAIAYSLFLWTSLELIGVWGASPDLCVAGFVYVIAGLLLRIRVKGSVSLYLILGAVLGLAYLTKAVMFPLGFAFIAIGFFAVQRRKKLGYLLVTTVAFLGVSAPWLVALSRAKGRFDFGDSGHLNYSTLVSPGGRNLNWQGQPPGSGVPLHTTRQIHTNPPVYEFATPVGGTYPPSFDPSYWSEGRRVTIDVRAQMRVIKEHLLLYAGLLLRDQPGLLAIALALILAGGVTTRKAILAYWPLFLMAFAACGLYMLVHVETRFVAAYVSIFWLAILAGIRLDVSSYGSANASSENAGPNQKAPDRRGELVDYLALAVVATILLSVADGTVRAVQAGGPYSARDEIAVADGLNRDGLQSGDRVAVVGNGNWFYWPRLGRFKIVSTIVGPDMPTFWQETPEQKEEIYRLFAGAGANVVVTAAPLPAEAGSGWRRIGNTAYYVHSLSQ